MVGKDQERTLKINEFSKTKFPIAPGREEGNSTEAEIFPNFRLNDLEQKLFR
jgi:hypothetical protein